MKLFFLTVALVCLMPAVARAESFNFVSRNEIVNRLVAPVAGSKTIVAQFSTGEIEATYPSRKILSKSNCATWPAPPGGLFTASGACVVTDPDTSQYTVVVSCRAVDEKNTLSDCFGQLTGIGGVYQAKTGTVSWRTTLSSDAKSTVSIGTGLWN